MKISIALMIATICAVLCLTAGVSYGEETVDYTYGIVEKVSGTEIVVSEYDYDTDADIQAVYTVTADTVFENVDSVGDIAEGDGISIDFVEEGGKRIAKMVSVEKLIEERPMTEEEYDTIE